MDRQKPIAFAEGQERILQATWFPFTPHLEALFVATGKQIKETPCVPLKGGGTQGVSALKPERYSRTPQVLESLVYLRG